MSISIFSKDASGCGLSGERSAGRWSRPGGGDFAFHVVNTTDGQDLWTYDLGRRTMGTPMTYRTASGKQVIVNANGLGRDSRLSAFALE
uniref:Pyrrolo-quinoline quinone n=1 Tax=Solibacter usitatus (strain Ellin6076) TaxID=234267 RepID=Q025N7_SOLUE